MLPEHKSSEIEELAIRIDFKINGESGERREAIQEYLSKFLSEEEAARINNHLRIYPDDLNVVEFSSAF